MGLCSVTVVLAAATCGDYLTKSTPNAKCPCYVVLLYAKCPCYVVLYMQIVLVTSCFVCKVSLLFSALYAKCLCYLVRNIQSVLVILCFLFTVSLLFSALYAKCPCYVVLFMQSALIMTMHVPHAHRGCFSMRACIAEPGSRSRQDRAPAWLQDLGQ